MNNVFRSGLGLCLAFMLSSQGALAADATPELLPPAYDGRIITYRRVQLNETLPQLGARLYDQVNYEVQLRSLKADIKVAEARLAVLRERSDFYDRYFSRTPALPLTRQETHVAKLEAELRLGVLKKQKQQLLRYRQDMVRYRQLVLAQGGAALRVNE